ncbi:MAG: cysteine hydrolase family protein [Pseudobdellovibrionaceae bacterium]
MKHPQFPLASDQLRLLLAFEESAGLEMLADSMGRDPSVISRGLQRIAEEFPVLVKVKGRWELTPLGRETNKLTKEFIARYQKLFAAETKKNLSDRFILPENSVLLVVNAQNGLFDSTQQNRNNSTAEDNILKLLEFWRKNKKKIIHVKHVSENPSSIFFKSSSGCSFLPMLAPNLDEEIIEKSRSSSFAETSLEKRLKDLEPNLLVIVGFTANECIDATARDAVAFGFNCTVVGDATAMFDLRDTDGKLIKAARLHKLTLANINAYYAKVVQTSDIV